MIKPRTPCPASYAGVHIPSVTQNGSLLCALCSESLGEVDLRAWWTQPPAGDLSALFLATAAPPDPESEEEVLDEHHWLHG